MIRGYYSDDDKDKYLCSVIFEFNIFIFLTKLLIYLRHIEKKLYISELNLINLIFFETNRKFYKIDIFTYVIVKKVTL